MPVIRVFRAKFSVQTVISIPMTGRIFSRPGKLRRIKSLGIERFLQVVSRSVNTTPDATFAERKATILFPSILKKRLHGVVLFD